MTEIPMPITTPRLLLRPIETGDAEAVLDFKKESWNEFQKWMVWVHPPSIETRTVEDEREFCARMRDRLARREAIALLSATRTEYWRDMARSTAATGRSPCSPLAFQCARN